MCIRVIQAAPTCIGQVGSQGGSPCLVAPARMPRRQQHQPDALHQLDSKLAHAHAGGCSGAVQQLHRVGPHRPCQGCQLSTLARFEDGSQCMNNTYTKQRQDQVTSACLSGLRSLGRDQVWPCKRALLKAALSCTWDRWWHRPILKLAASTTPPGRPKWCPRLDSVTVQYASTVTRAQSPRYF